MIIEEINPSFSGWSNTSRYGNDAWNLGGLIGLATAFGSSLGEAALAAEGMYSSANELTSPFGYTPEQAVWEFGQRINPGVNFAPGLDFNTKGMKGKFNPSLGWLDEAPKLAGNVGYFGDKPSAYAPSAPPPYFPGGGLPGYTGGKPNASAPPRYVPGGGKPTVSGPPVFPGVVPVVYKNPGGRANGGTGFVGHSRIFNVKKNK